MRRPDESKRRLILRIAARQFAAQPFHKVTLEAIAAAAHVGKGTLYTYFEGKEQLYAALLHEGFVDLVDKLERQLAPPRPGAWDCLGRIIYELLNFAALRPQLFELMRTVGVARKAQHWHGPRLRLVKLVESVLGQGIKEGQMRDAHPHITAAIIPGMVRALMLQPPADMDVRAMRDQVIGMLRHGIGKGQD